ncbi:hypothetical protein ISS86_02900 [Candidatus Microgenomates bacterium]|nr:hypothetical protein [Candidatus Microgenomates bacterium]
MEWLILFGVLGAFFLFVRFTIVKEGTAKAVMEAGALHRVIFQWKDHWMDTEWNIWREEEREEKEKEGVKEKENYGRIFGGLYFYGIWPVHKIHKYRLRWTDLRRVEEVGERIEKTQFHDEELKHVMLKPAVYWTKVFKVETLPPERIPVDIEMLVTMRILNPFLFLFIAPPTPLEDALARIDALMRAQISMLTMNEIISLKGRSGNLWGEEEKKGGLQNEKLIQETFPKWGLQIANEGIDIKSIGLSSEYQKAAAAKREEEMKAAGRGEEIMGTVISAVAIAEGVEKEEVQLKFKTDPQSFYEEHQSVIESVLTKLSIEKGAYLRIETPGATGMEGAFLNLIGAWKRMPGGGLEQEEKQKKEGIKTDEIKKPVRPETERIMKSALEIRSRIRGKR